MPACTSASRQERTCLLDARVPLEFDPLRTLRRTVRAGCQPFFSLGSRLKDARLYASVGRFKRVTDLGGASSSRSSALPRLWARARRGRSRRESYPSSDSSGPGLVGPRFRELVARTRLDRGADRCDRVSLCGGTYRTIQRNCVRVRPAQGECHRHGGRISDPRGKTCDIAHPNCLHFWRPCWKRPRRKFGPTGRQCDRPSAQPHQPCRQAPRAVARGCPRFPSLVRYGQCQ